MAERKRYINVAIPMLDQETRVLGTPENLNGKTIKLDLTRRLRGKGLTITFHLFNQDGKMVAIPKSLELVKSYTRRMMRKRVDYVEDSFTARCADIKATVKPLLITRKRVSRAVRRNLRNTTKEFLLEYLKEKDYNDICNELIDGILQKAMLPKLKKVYPLSFCDIRIFETKEIGKIDIKKALKTTKKDNLKEDIQEVQEESEDIQITEKKSKKKETSKLDEE